jgi:hypothetical protein
LAYISFQQIFLINMPSITTRFASIKNIVIALFIASLLAPFSSVHAQTTADPAYANMQRAVGGIVNNHVAANGYASSDPRTYQTLKAIGTAAVSGVAAAGAGVLLAGSSVAWGSVLAIAVVGSVISYGVSLGLDQLTKWVFSSSGVTPVSSSTNQSTTAITAGSQVYCSGTTCAATFDELVNAKLTAYCKNNDSASFPYCGSVTCSLPLLGRVCIGKKNILDTLIVAYVLGPNHPTSTSTISCALGQISENNVCASPSASNTNAPVSLANAFSGLSPQQLQQPVDYATMALMINKLWKDAAAQSGYQGVPYDVSNPVTSTEVQAYATANPTTYPSVGGLAAAIGSPGSAAVTTGLAPSVPTAPNQPVVPAVPDNPPGTTVTAPPAPTTDLGVDPNIRFVPPVAPTAQSILDPILNMLPGWRTATFTANGDCPKPNINFAPFMNLTVTMESHCNLIEQNRALISSLMSGVWLLIAALIVLAA